jgi:hypothetical protein
MMLGCPFSSDQHFESMHSNAIQNTQLPHIMRFIGGSVESTKGNHKQSMSARRQNKVSFLAKWTQIVAANLTEAMPHKAERSKPS